MFGWIKKQRLNEQLKLLFQNREAIATLNIIPELRNTTLFVDLEKINMRIELATEEKEDELLSLEDTHILLKVNKELRRLYDLSCFCHFKKFDENFVPIVGWKRYFNPES